MKPPTREEHDAIVATKGRPYTQDEMKPRKIDQPVDIAGLSIVDRVIADSRRVGGAGRQGDA